MFKSKLLSKVVYIFVVPLIMKAFGEFEEVIAGFDKSTKVG